jgi:hypothetical protein
VLEVLTPVMSITMLLLSLVSEQLWITLPGSSYFNSMEHTLITIALVFGGAVIAFLMVWTEYQVGGETSPAGDRPSLLIVLHLCAACLPAPFSIFDYLIVICHMQ